MPPPLITLTTDFGCASPYVAVMKGVIYSINPGAAVVDLTHDIRPQDVRHAAYFLGTAAPYFPPGTIQVCVVDPGVGSERVLLCLLAGGRVYVGPDNGVFTDVLRRNREGTVAHALTNPRYWRTVQPSDTFHGRDIFASVAAHLSLGVNPDNLGPVHTDPVTLPTRSAVTYGRQWSGEVLFVDDFGNVITNVPACKLKSLPVRLALNGVSLGVLPWVRTYSDAATGSLVCLFSSDGFFELAEVNGNAARRLGAQPGQPVTLEWD